MFACLTGTFSLDHCLLLFEFLSSLRLRIDHGLEDILKKLIHCYPRFQKHPSEIHLCMTSLFVGIVLHQDQI